MNSTASAILTIAGLAALLLPGLILITLGVRGRWRRDQPRCAGCGQIVGPHEIVERGRCPECGRDLAAEGGVRFFSRRVRPVAIVIGAILAIGSLAVPVAASLVIRATRPGGAGAMNLMSNDELITLVEDGSLGPARTALLELVSRAMSVGPRGGAAAGNARQAPSKADFDRLLQVIAALEPDDPRLGSAELGDLLLHAQSSGALTKERLEVLADRWFPPSRLLGVQPRIREGGGIQLANRTRDGSRPLACRAWIEWIECDGDRLPLQRWGGCETAWTDLDRGAATTLTAAPGRRTLRARLRRELYVDHAAAAAPLPPPGSPPGNGVGVVFSDEETVEIPVEVIAKDAESFIPMRSPADRRAEVIRACRADAVALDRMAVGPCMLHADAEVGFVKDLRLCFEIVVVLDGREIPVGWMSTHATGDGSTSTSAGMAASLECPHEVPRTVTVLFRPAPRRVEDQPGVDWIWGEPVEIRGVPVRSTLRDEEVHRP